MKTISVMKIPWNLAFLHALLLFLIFVFSSVEICNGQDYIFDDDDKKKPSTPPAPPPEQNDCNGIFLSYNFISREKELPHVKNVSAQAWAFKSEITVLNAGAEELPAWKMFVGFQHKELLVSVDGGVVMDGSDFPVDVSNGTYFSGFPQSDLKTSIETAGDINQIQAKLTITGTQFGLRSNSIPMPKSIRLENDGFKCPASRQRGKSTMFVCCKRDPKYKAKKPKATKFLPRQNGDLSLTYDILQAYGANYLAQVTIDNNNPLGRLDHWNLTWEWMRGEFINNMRGAYTHKKDPSGCIYGAAGKYYQDLDFSQVMNCEKRPIISDLPSEKANDDKVGKLPFCCRNGSLLPTQMDESKARSIFQLQVFKIPPDINRTALNPPQRWKINGILNPNYKCGPPIRVDPTEFPDPSGLQATSAAIASWQVVCNITRPKLKQTRCCVSFSAFYNDSVIPCNTCACGCEDTDTDTCNPNAKPLLLPPEAVLIPFDNRTEKAKAWAKLKHLPVPKKLPCPDNCGVSINWHINSNFRTGWTARITLFNWEDYSFEDWFAAFQIKKAYAGFENVYSFNGTRLPNRKDTIFMQGLKGLNFLVGETNGSHPDTDPRVPGKQQSVISFTKKKTPGISIKEGDGFPTRVFFNGEECALPTEIPKASAVRSRVSFVSALLVAVMTLVFLIDRFH
ncbi:hypothetical protein FEM48_Zijuj01G0224600 [Ziziphus jujuba var. spinosa]|uniref:COBRA C-terminal domain-containing protein n=1 Tax=Ziziphus jujuba var. spinosa TaxID=714518 RepID=A0A978W3X2_ZIZJJ|nr:hypothetical protein FEM48_Zijuj01G0224600 [Ziziphus jujuba var. spinosa]